MVLPGHFGFCCSLESYLAESMGGGEPKNMILARASPAGSAGAAEIREKHQTAGGPAGLDPQWPNFKNGTLRTPGHSWVSQ
jgi:hypothetical protein